MATFLLHYRMKINETGNVRVAVRRQYVSFKGSSTQYSKRFAFPVLSEGDNDVLCFPTWDLESVGDQIRAIRKKDILKKRHFYTGKVLQPRGELLVHGKIELRKIVRPYVYTGVNNAAEEYIEQHINLRVTCLQLTPQGYLANAPMRNIPVCLTVLLPKSVINTKYELRFKMGGLITRLRL